MEEKRSNSHRGIELGGLTAVHAEPRTTQKSLVPPGKKV
jgi:hypothetical protein